MDVPKEATVQVQTRDGDIYITGVGGAYAVHKMAISISSALRVR
jgi:hypothetical protein